MNPTYRGWRSTKLHASLISQGMVTLVYVAGMGCPTSAFGEYCLAMTGLAAGFMGSAVWAGKPAKTEAPPPAP